MRKILVFQHVASEPLGHLDPLLRESGFRIRYVNFGREPHAEPDVRRYDGLVVLGGPMNVDQVAQHPHLRTEMTVIREAITAGEPMLGICLGAQLLAAAMGGDVRPNHVPEIGWYRLHTLRPAHDDRLLRHFERRPHACSSGTPTRSRRRRAPFRSHGRATAATRPTASATLRGACSSTSRPTRR